MKMKNGFCQLAPLVKVAGQYKNESYENSNHRKTKSTVQFNA
ncbi:hypothetical protein L1283_003085 [Sphingobacterium sp. HSC-15S19]